MSLAFARSETANAALPGAVADGWYRLRRPGGRVLVWAVRDLTAIGPVSAWPSRQQAEVGAVNRAVVLPAAAFAAAADPVEVPTDG